MDPVSRREIEAGVRDALVRYGVRGQVVLRDGYVELLGGGRPVALDTQRLGADWPTMPLEARQGAVADVARRLADARAARGGLGR
ncbi:MAG TPA: hypothetical protein VHB21_27960 [Minicystis sp.]|nr:hypothetical protein [Minicystis sp.]